MRSKPSKGDVLAVRIEPKCGRPFNENVFGVTKRGEAEGVTHFQPMPGREGQRLAVTLHQPDGLGRTLLLQVERHDEAGIRVGFQIVPLFWSRRAVMVWSAIVFAPKTFFSRAAMSGIGRLAAFFCGHGINRAMACRLMVMATSSPASIQERMRGKSCLKSLTEAVFM